VIEASQYEDVLQIKMGHEVEGRVLYWVAAYLVDGLLVDTGCRHTAEELADFLEGKKLSMAVNTHYHEDHVGANTTLQERFGIPIYASSESVPLINQVPKLYPYQEMVWGYPEPSEVESLAGSVKTERYCFDVIETPGHCRGHVALVEREKGWCFTGDMFISRKPAVARREEDMAVATRSMARLMALDTERLVLFTALGSVVGDGRAALKACVEYLQDLARKAKELRGQGLSTADITERLLGGESFFASVTDGEFSRENLVRAVLKADDESQETAKATTGE